MCIFEDYKASCIDYAMDRDDNPWFQDVNQESLAYALDDILETRVPSGVEVSMVIDEWRWITLTFKRPGVRVVRVRFSGKQFWVSTTQLNVEPGEMPVLIETVYALDDIGIELDRALDTL